MKISMTLLLTGISLSILSSCCIVRSDYIAVNKIATVPKEINSVEVFQIKPKRSAIGLGFIKANGNSFSSQEDLIKNAKKKAAELGGDFILVQDAGTDKETVLNPGYSSFQSNGKASLSGNAYSIYGSANQNASGYSVGPSTSTYYFPWSVFSVWAYTPSNLGLNTDDEYIITGFHLNSDAESVGMMIGDKIIGIDGLDINDEGLSQHRMEIYPGDSVVFTILRDGKRRNYTLTALSN